MLVFLVILLVFFPNFVAKALFLLLSILLIGLIILGFVMIFNVSPILGVLSIIGTIAAFCKEMKTTQN